MEKEITKKPSKGTWDDLPTEEIERNPKVAFEVNITQRVAFMGEPKEYPSKDGSDSVYYVFDVKQGDEDKVIMTSAWTLLHEIKKLTPVAGKIVDITKRLEKGKQHFEIKEVV